MAKNVNSPTSIIKLSLQVGLGIFFVTNNEELVTPEGMGYQIVNVNMLSDLSAADFGQYWWIIGRSKSDPVTIIDAQRAGNVATGRVGIPNATVIAEDNLLVNNARLSIGTLSTVAVAAAHTLYLAVEVELVKVSQSELIHILNES